ncbi:MAG TPA: hypothetical protein VGD54_12665 [Steroidobacteraceae bacterium]
MSPRTWFSSGISSGFGRYTTELQFERGPVAGTFRKLEAVDDLKRQYGATRERIEGGAYLPPGDPAKMIRAIIASVDEQKAPKRLVRGSDAYTMIYKRLTQRIAALEAQKDLAFSTDFAAPSAD